MNKALNFVIFFFSLLFLTACSESKENKPTAISQTSTLEVTHRSGTTIVPLNPKRIVTFDLGSLDNLEALGVDIIGLPKANLPIYLDQYKDEKYLDFGSLKEPNFEAIHAASPDLIIISDRQAPLYDDLTAIAPTINLNLDYTLYLDSLKENLTVLASLTDKEEEANGLWKELQKIITKAQNATDNNNDTALIVLVNDRTINAYGAGSRFGLIYTVLGMKEADEAITVSTHGQNISFEYMMQTNPDVIFVISRNLVFNPQDNSARTLMDNPLIKETNAFKNKKIVYLNPTTWYLAGGGIQATLSMIEEVIQALGQ